jgi:hypothetical protein
VDQLTIKNVTDSKIIAIRSYLILHNRLLHKSQTAYFDEGHLSISQKVYSFVGFLLGFQFQSKSHVVFFLSRDIEKTVGKADNSTI